MSDGWSLNRGKMDGSYVIICSSYIALFLAEACKLNAYIQSIMRMTVYTLNLGNLIQTRMMLVPESYMYL